MTAGEVTKAEVIRSAQGVAFNVNLWWRINEGAGLSASTSMHGAESVVASKDANALKRAGACPCCASWWQEG